MTTTNGLVPSNPYQGKPKKTKHNAMGNAALRAVAGPVSSLKSSEANGFRVTKGTVSDGTVQFNYQDNPDCYNITYTQKEYGDRMELVTRDKDILTGDSGGYFVRLYDKNNHYLGGGIIDGKDAKADAALLAKAKKILNSNHT